MGDNLTGERPLLQSCRAVRATDDESAGNHSIKGHGSGGGHRRVAISGMRGVTVSITEEALKEPYKEEPLSNPAECTQLHTET